MKALTKNFREILQYPSAIAGLVIIFGLVALAAYTLITLPYNEAINLWRGNEADWYQNPKNAPPVWYNWLSSFKEPESIRLRSVDGSATRTESVTAQGTKNVIFNYQFDYQYDGFPQALVFYFKSTYTAKQPFASIKWITPDGREIRIADLGTNQTYIFAQDDRLVRRLGREAPETALFRDPNSDSANPTVLKGTYQLVVDTLVFEENSSIEDAEFVLQGKVSGIAGTDHRRRDLMIALLWGAPVALAFGLLAAVGVTALTLIISAIGVWMGGWVDELIQRITEVNLVLPFLSILIMVGTFYSKSIWIMLGLTIVLSIFSGAIKSYRAIFMQTKESTYIEAARAYGAGNTRIIFRYLIPRIIPVLIPGLVLSIPGFVFLEATLALLGLGDPVLPTWGKVIYDANQFGATYNGFYYWILEPAVLLMITGLGFALVGYSLDRIFNPRLRGL
jgi:peptide/nickel transport system permease protein